MTTGTPPDAVRPRYRAIRRISGHWYAFDDKYGRCASGPLDEDDARLHVWVLNDDERRATAR